MYDFEKEYSLGWETINNIPQGYHRCTEVNDFLTIDLKEKSVTLLPGIKYAIQSKINPSIFWHNHTFHAIGEKTQSKFMLKFRDYLSQGWNLYIERFPLYMTFQTQKEVQNSLIEKRFNEFIQKANFDKKLQLQLSEEPAAYDFHFDLPTLPYRIFCLKKTGVSKITLGYPPCKSKDDIRYAVEHVIKQLEVKKMA